MPLPSLLCLVFAAGIAAALAGRVELRVSPRPALLTHSFAAFAIFACLVVVPISVYFYIFHGDWFLLYLIDVRDVPSALALLGFVVEVGFGALGFFVGASMVRHQREGLGGSLAFLALIAAALVVVIARDRLSLVGTSRQFHGNFGLEPFMGGGAILQGAIVMGAILLVATASLLQRLRSSSRRGE